jgi:hypothetical protein
MRGPQWNFEGERPFPDMSETGINLCAYFDAMPDEKMRTYRPEFSDEELMHWDGNFTSEGNLLLPCCESEEVDPAMYRAYIEACIRYRDRMRSALAAPT